MSHVRQPLGHESARGHVTGRAVYTDEQYPGVGLLSLYPVQAPHAHARILGIDSAAARAMPGQSPMRSRVGRAPSARG